MFLSAGTILGSFLSFFLQIFHTAAAVSSCLKNKMKPLSDFLSGHLRNLIAHPVVLVLPCPFSHVFLFSSIATVPALVPALGPPRSHDDREGEWGQEGGSTPKPGRPPFGPWLRHFLPARPPSKYLPCPGMLVLHAKAEVVLSASHGFREDRRQAHEVPESQWAQISGLQQLAASEKFSLPASSCSKALFFDSPSPTNPKLLVCRAIGVCCRFTQRNWTLIPLPKPSTSDKPMHSLYFK